MVARDGVVMGYRFLLGREPESEETVTALSQLGSLAELRDAFIRSAEFQRSLHSPGSLPAIVTLVGRNLKIGDAARPQLIQDHLQHVFELFRRQGCDLIDIREDGWVGDQSIVSNSVMLRKSE